MKYPLCCKFKIVTKQHSTTKQNHNNIEKLNCRPSPYTPFPALFPNATLQMASNKRPPLRSQLHHKIHNLLILLFEIVSKNYEMHTSFDKNIHVYNDMSMEYINDVSKKYLNGVNKKYINGVSMVYINDMSIDLLYVCVKPKPL